MANLSTRLLYQSPHPLTHLIDLSYILPLSLLHDKSHHICSLHVSGCVCTRWRELWTSNDIKYSQQ